MWWLWQKKNGIEDFSQQILCRKIYRVGELIRVFHYFFSSEDVITQTLEKKDWKRVEEKRKKNGRIVR